MGIIVRNVSASVSASLTALKLVGFWTPEGLTPRQKTLYRCYSYLSFMFLLGIYLIIQVIDLFMIWGDLLLMTGTAFILFTNLAQSTKIVNILVRRRRIQRVIDGAEQVLGGVDGAEARAIVASCNREQKLHQIIFFGLTVVTTLGWATSAESGQLPLRAWYPYDTSKSPAYELTYLHQVGALLVAAYLNVGKDTLVTGLIAQCRCRLQLLALALRTLGQGLLPQKHRFSSAQETILSSRLRLCVQQHKEALEAADELQQCFSAPTFAQFTVSLVIICVTAFQMVSLQHSGNLVRLASMCTYLVNMMFQVFIYCYQGHHLSEESMEVAGAAYESPWYACSAKLRRSLLIVMTRTRYVTKLRAGGFTAMSLASFMAIIKASYSMFTLLQRVNEK